MNGQNGSLAADVEAGVLAAYVEGDYATLPERPPSSRAKVLGRIFEVLKASEVTSWADRLSSAVTRGSLTEQVFPGPPGPEQFAEQDDPRLAELVWDKLTAELWGMTTTSSGSALQKLVSRSMGNGYILCRTKIGKDETPAVYITDDMICIERDFIRPDNDSMERKMRTWTRNRVMVIERKPADAPALLRKGTSTLKALSSAAGDRAPAGHRVGHGRDAGRRRPARQSLRGVTERAGACTARPVRSL